GRPCRGGRPAAARRPRLLPRAVGDPASSVAGQRCLAAAGAGGLAAPARDRAEEQEYALVAYRVALDDLLDWADATGRNLFEEATIVGYLTAYQQRAQPAQATYYRRFLVLRK